MKNCLGVVLEDVKIDILIQKTFGGMFSGALNKDGQSYYFIELI